MNKINIALIFTTMLFFSGCGDKDDRIKITTTSLPDAELNANYFAQLGLTQARGRTTWSIRDGTLPPGLDFDPRFGIISGSPITSETQFFTVSVTDGRRSDSAELSIVVEDQ